MKVWFCKIIIIFSIMIPLPNVHYITSIHMADCEPFITMTLFMIMILKEDVKLGLYKYCSEIFRIVLVV